MYPVSYDRLQLIEDQPTPPADRAAAERRSHADELWIGLASAALAIDVNGENEATTDPVAIARSIDDHQKSEGYDQVIVGYMLQITNELKTGNTDTSVLRRRISSLLTAVRPDTLRRLVHMGGDLQQRREFVADASHGVAVDALIQIVQAASESSTRAISHSLMRMLSKLAAHAEGGTDRIRPQADGALREQVRELFAGWELNDPNPEEYSAVLEDLSRATAGTSAAGGDRAPDDSSSTGPDPVRLVQMALEAEIAGPGVWYAVDQLVEQRAIGTLIGLLESVPAANPTAKMIWERIASADAFRRLIAADAVDPQALNYFVASLGLDAAPPMLDKLIESSSRAERRILIGQLVHLGPKIGPLAIERLNDERWFVQRNVLALLGGLTSWPTDFSAAPYTRHSDDRVRREAFRLMLKMPTGRDQALLEALQDENERIVAIALTAAQQDCPDAAVQLIVERLTERRFQQPLRVLAIHTLGTTKSPSAFSTLLPMALAQGSLWRRSGLARKSPELIAALTELARNWPGDTQAAIACRLAEKSSDPEIRAAVNVEALES